MLLLKLFGSFRWLAFIIGAALVASVSWVLWPNSVQNVQKEGVKTSEKVVFVRDSTQTKILRDSIFSLRNQKKKIFIRRIIEKDTTGRTIIILDSGAILLDTSFSGQMRHDTVVSVVRDTFYRESVKTDGKGPLKQNTVWGSVSYSETKIPDVNFGIRRKIKGPLYGSIYGRWDDSWEEGVGIGVSFNFGSLEADLRNYGYHNFDPGWKLKAALNFSF